MPQPAPVQPGDILAGKYRVERVLGAGGMGVVVAARHLDLDELRAVKLMHPVQVENAQAVERFLREARATVRLRSEHIPRLYDVGRLESGAPYIVMEVLEGSDLRTLLKARGILPIQEAVLYVLQTCEAVAEAHAAGIIHRDLKPANLFLTSRPDGSPCIKVLDFGISKLLEPGPGADMTKTLDVLGSIHYMAPEQLRSSRSVDARADIWSIGVILYRLLTGRLPFHGDTPVAYILSLREEFHAPSAFRSDLPPGLDGLVMRCLEKDPEKRIPSVKALMSELAPYTLGGSIPAALAGEAGRGSRTGTAGQPVEINTLESWSVTQPMSESSVERNFLRGGTAPIPLAMRASGRKVDADTPPPQGQSAPTYFDSRLPAGISGEGRSSESSGYYNAPSPEAYQPPEEIDSFTGTAPTAPPVFTRPSSPYPLSGIPDSRGMGTLASSPGYYPDTIVESGPPGASPSSPELYYPYSEAPSAPGSYPEAESTGPLPSTDEYSLERASGSGADDATAVVPEYYSGPPPLQTMTIRTGGGAGQETATVKASAAAARKAPSKRSKSLFSLPVFVLLGCAVGGLAGVIFAITLVNVRFGPAPVDTVSPAVAPAPVPAPSPTLADPAPTPSPAPALIEPAPTAVEIDLPDPDDVPPAPTQPAPPATQPPSPPAFPPATARPPQPQISKPRPPPPPPKPTATAVAPPPEPPRPGPIFE
jgi:serine/threonine-protein kinase